MKSITLLLCLLVSGGAWALPDHADPGQGPDSSAPMARGFGIGHGGPGPAGPPRGLYPPEMLLSNQVALGLTDEQVQALKSLLKATHDATLDTQIALQRAAETLQRALEAPRIDESAALMAADQVMALETSMKKGHLALMIRIKNLLTADQLKLLETMRPQDPRSAPRPPQQ